MGRPEAGVAAETVPLRRVYSQMYDSVFQRSLVAAAPPVDLPLAHPLFARLRLDVVLSGQVVLTDAQVLDGSWFTSVGPAMLVENLRIVPVDSAPLVVRLRRGSVVDSVSALLGTPDGRVKAFEFSSLPEQERTVVLEGLRAAHDRGDPAPTGLDDALGVLSRAGLDAQRCDDLGARWLAWDAAARAGQVAVETYDLGRADTGVLRRQVASLLRLEIAEVLAGPLERGPQLLDAFETGMTRTSLYEAAATVATDRTEQQTLVELVDRAFGQLFRLQHDAKDFDDRTNLALRPISGQRRGVERTKGLAERGWTDIDLGSEFLVRLAVADGASMRQWGVEYGERLSSWRANGQGAQRDLRVALRQLEREVLAAVPDARVHEIAGLPFRALTRPQELLRLLEPAQGLAVDESLAAAAQHVPALSQLTRLRFGTKVLHGMATFRRRNWRLLSSDFALQRRKAS